MVYTRQAPYIHACAARWEALQEGRGTTGLLRSRVQQTGEGRSGHTRSAAIYAVLGEEPTLSRYYTSHWNDAFFGGKFVWSHRFQNMIILVGFILFFRFATFYALERINYSTR